MNFYAFFTRIVPDILKGVVSTPKDDTVLFIKHVVVEVTSLYFDVGSR